MQLITIITITIKLQFYVDIKLFYIRKVLVYLYKTNVTVELYWIIYVRMSHKNIMKFNQDLSHLLSTSNLYMH